MNKKLKFILRILIGISILYYLIKKVEFNKLTNTIISFNPKFLGLYLILLIIFLIIGALNLKILTDPIKRDIPFKRIFKYFLVSWALGAYLPAKIGELSLIHLYKRESIDYGKGLVIFIIDKLITLLVFSLFSIAGLIVFFDFNIASKITILLIITVLIILITIMSELGRSIIKRYILRKFSKNFIGFSQTFIWFLKENKKIMFYNFILTIIRLFVLSISTYILFIGFGYNISILKILLITAIISILALIPISISGIGVREGGAGFLFGLIGIPLNVTLSVYLIMVITGIIITTPALLFFNIDKIR
ncbi:flippase-like domain-containing protein [Candidatus Woesearchaeota archaeon]|nr:flippase-like domain-containing protein [Candidatus Woesearchaeota archaeon]